MLSQEAKDRHFDLKALSMHLPLNYWADSFLKSPNQPTLSCFEHEGSGFAVWRASRPEALQRYRLLETLAAYHLPVADPLTMRTRETATGEETVVFCSLPERAQPLELLLGSLNPEADGKALSQAVAALVVHLHLAGFHLRPGTRPALAVRREQTGFTAFLINPMEGELLEDCQAFRRAMDLQMVADELQQSWTTHCQVQQLEDLLEPLQMVRNFLESYNSFWSNIHQTAVIIDDQVMLSTRVTHLDKSGFNPEEYTRENGPGLRLKSRITPVRYHKMMLHMLTGITTAGNQGARKLLQDINRYRSWLEFSSGRKWSKALAANHWMNEVYYPAIQNLPSLFQLATV